MVSSICITLGKVRIKDGDGAFKHTSPALTVMKCGIKFVPSECPFISPAKVPTKNISEFI